MSDESTPGKGEAVSVRVVHGQGWRLHVPTALLLAVGVALNGGTCSSTERIEHKVDALLERVSRLEGRLDGQRVADSTGGAASYPSAE